MDILKRALEKYPKEPNIYLLMGEIHFHRGEKDPMRQMYRRFLDMYPDAPQRRSLEKRMQE